MIENIFSVAFQFLVNLPSLNFADLITPIILFPTIFYLIIRSMEYRLYQSIYISAGLLTLALSSFIRLYVTISMEWSSTLFISFFLLVRLHPAIISYALLDVYGEGRYGYYKKVYIIYLGFTLSILTIYALIGSLKTFLLETESYPLVVESGEMTTLKYFIDLPSTAIILFSTLKYFSFNHSRYDTLLILFAYLTWFIGVNIYGLGIIGLYGIAEIISSILYSLGSIVFLKNISNSL